MKTPPPPSQVCDGVSHDSIPRITSGLKVCIRLSNSATLSTMDWQFTERKWSGRLACLSCLLALDWVDVRYGWNGLSEFVSRDKSAVAVMLCWVRLRPCRS